MIPIYRSEKRDVGWDNLFWSKAEYFTKDQKSDILFSIMPITEGGGTE